MYASRTSSIEYCVTSCRIAADGCGTAGRAPFDGFVLRVIFLSLFVDAIFTIAGVTVVVVVFVVVVGSGSGISVVTLAGDVARSVAL